MNVLTAKEYLKRYGFDDDDPLLVWLNAGKNEVEEAYDWPFLQIRTTVSASAGDDELTLPSDAFKVQSVRIANTTQKLTYMDVEGFEREIGDATTTGQPWIYTVVGTKQILLNTILDVATDFRVIYQEELDDIETLADTDPLPGPSRIHFACVMGAAYLALQAENEEERATTAQNQFDGKVRQLWGKFNSQELDEPQAVVDVMGYGRS